MTMNQFDERNRRRVFRLRFPSCAMLQATIGNQPYEVLELAEFSLWVTAPDVPNLNGICTGILTWSDGNQSSFVGEVGPRKNGGRIICNIQGIRMNDVVSEQRRLIAKFPVVSFEDDLLGHPTDR